MTHVVLAQFISFKSKFRGERMVELNLSSPSFENNKPIPDKYTCKGEDISPELNISGIPGNTKSLVLIVDDPDAPVGTWVHWVVWNIPLTNRIEEGTVPTGSMQGVNDFNKKDYGGPCPPSGTHRYFFKLYVLDITLELPDNSGKADVENAIQGHVITQTQLIGLYSKS